MPYTNVIDRQAHQAAMSTTDFLSLLMTKTNPTQAIHTVSPQLKETLSIGTFGMDKISPRDTRLTIARRDDNKVVGKGWKIQALGRSVDSILAAATRLEREIDCETKYWEEILAVDQKGWKTCKLPQERNTLGVRFGFFEAASSFRNRSLAALQRAEDGSVYLDQGVSDATPKRVLIRIETDGVITGSLKPERAVPDDAPLEALILRARNSIFEEELWQELNREARSLANHDVRWDGTGLSVKISPSIKALLSLEVLDDTLPVYQGSSENGGMAEMISLSLHLLLLYNHRQNLQRRRQPPPPISHQPRSPFPANILRPMLKRIHHEGVISTLSSSIVSVHAVLKYAGIDVPAHTFTASSGDTSKKCKKPRAEAVLDNLIQNLEAEFKVPLTTKPEQSLTIKLRTEFNLHTRWHITAQAPQGFVGSLHEVARPPSAPSDVADVKAYILWAAGAALAVSLSQYGRTGLSTPLNEDAMDVDVVADSVDGWDLAVVPALLRKIVKGGSIQTKEIGFVFKEKERLQLEVDLKNTSGIEERARKLIYTSDSAAEDMKLADVLKEMSNWSGRTSTSGLLDMEKWSRVNHTS